MKKTLMSAIILASTIFAANAQTGTVLVGGDISLQTQKQPTTPAETKTTNLSFNPYVGYQFTDKLTVGITGSVVSQKQKQGPDEDKFNAYNVGPFLRYTQTLSDIFSVYGQVEGRYGSGKSKSNGSTFGKFNTTNVNLFPAVFINLKNSFGLNFNIGGISYSNLDPKVGESTNGFDINFGKTLTIGVSKNFGSKK